jgi:hypothetical protein
LDNIKTDLGEICLGGVDWCDLSQEWDKWRTLVNTAMNLRFSQNVEKLSVGYSTGGLLE